MSGRNVQTLTHFKRKNFHERFWNVFQNVSEIIQGAIEFPKRAVFLQDLPDSEASTKSSLLGAIDKR